MYVDNGVVTAIRMSDLHNKYGVGGGAKSDHAAGVARNF